jgi:hypothetical protein
MKTPHAKSDENPLFHSDRWANITRRIVIFFNCVSKASEKGNGGEECDEEVREKMDMTRRRGNLANKVNWVHSFSYYAYFFSLHVSGEYVPIIRRKNCIYATLGTCYSVWMTVWYNNKYQVPHKYSCFS